MLKVQCITATLLFLALFPISGHPAFANKYMFCTEYANRALEQDRLQLANRCKFPWGTTKRAYLDWCYKVSEAEAKRVLATRSLKLKRCTASRALNESCDQYAKTAISQENKQRTLGCGFPWKAPYQAHKDFCLRVGANRAKIQLAIRNSKLQSCRQGRVACKQYAQTAVAQQALNIRFRCGFKPTYIIGIKVSGWRWSNNYNSHFHWCLQMFSINKKARASDETKHRNRELKQCICRYYGRVALEQQKKAKAIGCGFREHGWFASFQAHQSWCAQVGASQVTEEIAKRNRRLAECQSKSKRCHTFSLNLIEYTNTSNRLRCGFRGAGWGTHYPAHFGYCMSISKQKANALLQKNTAQMKRCRPKSSNSSKTKRCQDFSRKLMEYSRINNQYRCGFIGAGWGLNYQAHFGYCMNISAQAANALLNYNARKAKACHVGSAALFLRTKCDPSQRPTYMKQIALNQTLKCGYHGLKWSQGYISARCRSAYGQGRNSQNPYRRQLEQWDRERKLELEKCAQTNRRCKAYADAAINDVKANQRMKCGHWGDRWSTYWNHHYDWCRRVSAQHLRNEANARKRELNQCQQRRR